MDRASHRWQRRPLWLPRIKWENQHLENEGDFLYPAVSGDRPEARATAHLFLKWLGLVKYLLDLGMVLVDVSWKWIISKLWPNFPYSLVKQRNMWVTLFNMLYLVQKRGVLFPEEGPGRTQFSRGEGWGYTERSSWQSGPIAKGLWASHGVFVVAGRGERKECSWPRTQEHCRVNSYKNKLL